MCPCLPTNEVNESRTDSFNSDSFNAELPDGPVGQTRVRGRLVRVQPGTILIASRINEGVRPLRGLVVIHTGHQ